MRFFVLVIGLCFLFSCKDDSQVVLPYSPVTFYPIPFYDTVNVGITSSSNWEVSFLDKKGKNLKKYSGVGDTVLKVGFETDQSQTIIAQTKIGSTVYVNELLSIKK